MDNSTSSQKYQNEDDLDFWKVDVLNYYSAVKENIPTELLAFPVFQIVGKNGPLDPSRPRTGFVPVFSDIFSMGSQKGPMRSRCAIAA